MGEFFKGWRKKTGVVTLMMACVFATAWVRSLSFEDEFVLPNTQRVTLAIVSNDGSLAFSKTDAVSPSTVIPSPYWWTYGTGPRTKIESTLKELGATSVSSTNFSGFCAVRAKLTNPPGWKGPVYDYDVTYWTVPYGYIVIPLTLLSSYLLLTKRH